jgi:ribosome recycling factor
MKIAFQEADQKLKESIEYFKNQIGALRVGRGSLQMIESIRADVYGQSMPLNQIANINMMDATLVTVAPWDKNNIQSIVKAVQTSNLGINPSVDQDVVKLPIPPLTEERRKEYLKIANQKGEEAKIAVRQIRKEIIDTIEQDKKDGNFGEDEEKRMEKELQKKIDSTNSEIELIIEDKQKELMSV